LWRPAGSVPLQSPRPFRPSFWPVCTRIAFSRGRLMGARGPVGRPGEHRQGHREASVVDLVHSRPNAAVPKPPPGLPVATKTAWARYWTSDVASVVTDADHDAIERLFLLR